MSDRDHYLLMDARATDDVDRAAILLSGSVDECCKAATNGDFGLGCVVVAPDGEPAWHLIDPEATKAKNGEGGQPIWDASRETHYESRS